MSDKTPEKVRPTISEYVRAIVARAPELTDAQVEEMRSLLRPVAGGAAE